jgi:integrase
VIVIRRSKSRRPREVGMTRRLLDAMTRHLATLKPDEDVVFRVRPSNRPFHRYQYRDAFTHATKAAGLEGFRFHDCRHSAGVRLAEAGATPATIKAVLGHRCLAATLRYMDHAPLDAARTAARLLDSHRDAESPPAAAGTGGL